MEIQVQSFADGAANTGSLEVADDVFARDYNEPLIHQVVTAYMAGNRAGTKANKNRAAVRGGGAKPWRQKGTGRARAGTTRGPIWRGGGVTFAAKPRDYSQKVNRKMYRGAITSILSELLRTERMVVVDSLDVEQPKTKVLAEILKGRELTDVLLIAEEISENLFLAARNLHWVGVTDVDAVDPVLLISYDKTLITSGALSKLQETLS